MNETATLIPFPIDVEQSEGTCTIDTYKELTDIIAALEWRQTNNPQDFSNDDATDLAELQRIDLICRNEGYDEDDERCPLCDEYMDDCACSEGDDDDPCDSCSDKDPDCFECVHYEEA